MNISFTDDFEEMTIEWQYRVASILKKRLIDEGVECESAKNICSEFIFNVAMLHDQEALNVKGSVLRPIMAFIDQDKNIYIDTQNSIDLHDTALGVVDELFKQG